LGVRSCSKSASGQTPALKASSNTRARCIAQVKQDAMEMRYANEQATTPPISWSKAPS